MSLLLALCGLVFCVGVVMGNISATSPYWHGLTIVGLFGALVTAALL